MSEAPTKPSRLSLWMSENGRPSQIKVQYRPTGVDTADTWVVLTVFDGYGKKQKSIDVRPGEFGWERYGCEVYLTIDHAHVMDWTPEGRKQLEEWQAFNKREARDIAEYKRLQAKFGCNV